MRFCGFEEFRISGWKGLKGFGLEELQGFRV